jgi:hypothetical protein
VNLSVVGKGWEMDVDWRIIDGVGIRYLINKIKFIQKMKSD